MKFRTATYLPISEAYLLLHNIVFHIPKACVCSMLEEKPLYFHTNVILNLTAKPVATRPTLAAVAACKDIIFLDLSSFKKNILLHWSRFDQCYDKKQTNLCKINSIYNNFKAILNIGRYSTSMVDRQP